MKTCTGPCGETKTDDMFPKGRRKCRACVNKYHREYKNANKDQLNEKKRKRYAQNREREVARKIKYQRDNKEQRAAYARQYHKDNKEHINFRTIVHHSLTRAKDYGVEGMFTVEEVRMLYRSHFCMYWGV
jgi:hypothetical protein